MESEVALEQIRLDKNTHTHLTLLFPHIYRSRGSRFCLRKPHCVFGFRFLNVTTQVRSHRFQFPIVAHQAAVGAASSQLTPPRRGSRFRLR